MPPREWRLRLYDIVEAIDRVFDYVDELDFDSFKADRRTIDAVVRNLEVIGEAARHVPDEVVERFPNVPWARMRAMRHILAHEYFGVDLRVVWKAATEDLPAVKPAIAAILDATHEEPGGP
ncbi:MAG: HepT-like ribonuclease domain-containing protein [Pseudomonadota bacterium]